MLARLIWSSIVPFALFTASDWAFHIPFKERWKRNLLMTMLTAVIVQLAFYWPDPAMNLGCFIFGYFGAGTRQLMEIRAGKRKHTDPLSGFIIGLAVMALAHYFGPMLTGTGLRVGK